MNSHIIQREYGPRVIFSNVHIEGYGAEITAHLFVTPAELDILVVLNNEHSMVGTQMWAHIRHRHEEFCNHLVLNDEHSMIGTQMWAHI